MTLKKKYLLLYFILNLLPAFPVAFLMNQYHNYPVIVDMLYYGLWLNMFAYKYTKFCPFKIIAKYVVYTDGLNFWKYWKRAYGRRNICAVLTYGTYGLFVFVLTILLV